MGRLLGFIYGGVPWLEIEEAVSFLDHIQMQELFLEWKILFLWLLTLDKLVSPHL